MGADVASALLSCQLRFSALAHSDCVVFRTPSVPTGNSVCCCRCDMECRLTWGPLVRGPVLEVSRPPAQGTVAWFCVRTHPKHEHIAAAQLRQAAGIEVFVPRIRYRRSTRLGVVWVTEALFKDYIFARFDLATAVRLVQHARAVRCVVRFGDRWPSVPDDAIAELREVMGAEDLRVIEDTMQPGDVVRISEGAMAGLHAVVARVVPAKQRVAVLLEFLGRQTTVELAHSQVALDDENGAPRLRLPVWTKAQRSASPLT